MRVQLTTVLTIFASIANAGPGHLWVLGENDFKPSNWVYHQAKTMSEIIFNDF
jgi:hypothetical protein